MTKLTDEQKRLLRWLEAGAGSQSKTSVMAGFSRVTLESLIRKGLVTDDFAIGYYSIKAKATVNNLLEGKDAKI